MRMIRIVVEREILLLEEKLLEEFNLLMLDILRKSDLLPELPLDSKDRFRG